MKPEESVLKVRRAVLVKAAPARVWAAFESHAQMNLWWGLVTGDTKAGTAQGQHLEFTRFFLVTALGIAPCATRPVVEVRKCKSGLESPPDKNDAGCNHQDDDGKIAEAYVKRALERAR